MARRKKLAIFQKELWVGGIQKSLLNLIANLDREKYEIDLYLYDKNIFYDVDFPENVTVHTLSMKRASNLVVRHLSDYSGGEQAAAMTAYADRMLTADGYHPYYLYRQARMVGNQENVGWSKDGHDGLYNVWIMDESQTILACGAGAATKLKDPYSPHVERIFNHKFPYEYNDRFAELIERKQGILDFYARYPISKEASR